VALSRLRPVPVFACFGLWGTTLAAQDYLCCPFCVGSACGQYGPLRSAKCGPMTRLGASPIGINSCLRMSWMSAESVDAISPTVQRGHFEAGLALILLSPVSYAGTRHKRRRAGPDVACLPSWIIPHTRSSTHGPWFISFVISWQRIRIFNNAENGTSVPPGQLRGLLLAKPIPSHL
jgi:hypothetical protein